MADEADDVLELAPETEVEEVEEEQQQTDGEAGDEGEGETFIGFEGEEAAPASEGDNSVIRELRAKVRELTAEVRRRDTGTKAERIEVGAEPSLEACDYDEDRFKTEWQEWNGRKAKAARQEAEAQERREAQEQAERGLRATYEADKARLGIPDFEEREAEVFAALPPDYDKLLLHSGKGAELIAALSNSPAKLEALSKTTPLEAAMMVGELRSKLQMGTRKPPQPDRPVRGNAAPVAADKELERLEKEAVRTGDRTKVIAYKRKLRDRA